MAMRQATVRFTEQQWTTIKEEADAEGISLAQFVREASLIRATWLRVRRGDLEPELDAIAQAVEQLRD